MPRQSKSRLQTQRARTKTNSTKTNGTKTKRQKGNGAWTPQQRGSAKAWLERLGYTPATLRCRTLADMTEAEIAAIEQEYNAKVLRPISGQRRNGSRPRPKMTASRNSAQSMLASPDVFSEEVEIQDGF